MAKPTFARSSKTAENPAESLAENKKKPAPKDKKAFARKPWKKTCVIEAVKQQSPYIIVGVGVRPLNTNWCFPLYVFLFCRECVFAVYGFIRFWGKYGGKLWGKWAKSSIGWFVFIERILDVALFCIESEIFLIKLVMFS